MPGDVKTILKNILYTLASVVLFLACVVAFYLLWQGTAGAVTRGHAVAGNCTADGTGVVQAWLSMDEASGNLTVPTGCASATKVLTVNGSPSYSDTTTPNGLKTSIGGLGNTAYFKSSSSNSADGFDVQTQNMVSEVWVKFPTFDDVSGSYVYSKGGYAGIRAGHTLYTDASRHPIFSTSDGAGNMCVATASTSTVDTSWHYWRATWNNSTGTCTVAMDGGTPGSTTNATMIGHSLTSVRFFWYGAGDGGGYNTTTVIGDYRLCVGATALTACNTYAQSASRVYQAPFSLTPNVPTYAEQRPGNCSDPNVAAYFSMDNASGNLTVPSGCAASGTVLTANGTPTYSQSAPPGLNTSITFNGTTDYFVASGNVASLNPLTSPMVVEAWINTTNTSTTNTIMSKFNNTTTGWLFDQTTTGRFFISDGSTTCSVSTGATLGDGAWHYVRATWNGTNICTISASNGGSTQSTTQAVGSVSVTTAPVVGARQNTNNKWSGSIADLRVTIGNATNSAGFNDGTLIVTEPVSNKAGNCSDSNVAAWLSMNETSGNLTVPAGCTAGATVFTASGTPVYSQSAPPGLGTAISFNGTTDYFDTGADTTSLNPLTSSMVIEGWFKTSSTSAGTVINKASGASRGWSIDNSGNASFMRFRINDGTNDCTAQQGSTSNDGNWHYFRATWNGSNSCTMTQDGGTTTTGTQALGSVSTTAGVGIGSRSSPSPGILFAGQIADLRVTIGNSTNSLGFNNIYPTNVIPSTFTRATVSTRYNPTTQLVEAVASGVPVIGAPMGVTGGVLPAPGKSVGLYTGVQTTFRLLQNQDMTSGTGGWTNNAGITATANTSDVTAPDGTSTATKIVNAAANNSGFYRNATSTTIGTNTETVWLRGAVGGETLKLYITESGGIGDQFSAVTLTTAWKRFVFTVTTTTNTTIASGVLSDGSANTFYVWRPQIYSSDSIFQADPAVAGAAVTINTDMARYKTQTGTTAFSVSGWAWDCSHLNGGLQAASYLLTLDGAANAQKIQLGTSHMTNSDQIGFNISFGSAGVFGGNNTAVHHAWHHYVFTMTNASAKVYLDGPQFGSTNTAITLTPGTATDLYVGMRADVSGNCTSVSKLALYPSILSASDVQALYNTQSASLSLLEEAKSIMLATLDGRAFFDLITSFFTNKSARPTPEQLQHDRWKVEHLLPKPSFRCPFDLENGANCFTDSGETLRPQGAGVPVAGL